MTKFYKQPPYTIIFRKNREGVPMQEFIYIGSEHSHDINHPQFGIIQRYWEHWLDGKDSSNCIALIEGGTFDPSQSLEDATYENAERGFLAWKAKQENMQFDSPEPDDKQEIQHLLQEFSKEEIFHYYFIRDVVQWYWIDSRPDFHEHFGFIPRMPERYGIENYELTLEKLKDIHKDITGQEFDPEDIYFLKRLGSSSYDKAITNKIAARSVAFRDQHIVEEIEKHWNKGKNIFSVYGFSHVEEQEDRLKQLLQ